MKSKVTSKSYTETLTELHSLFELPNTNTGRDVDLQELCNKFLELVAHYCSNTLDETRNYIEETKMQRMKNFFPYFLSILPNRFMVRAKPNFSLARPLKINYGDILTAENKPQNSQDKKKVPQLRFARIY